jgi:hypothetical protein
MTTCSAACHVSAVTVDIDLTDEGTPASAESPRIEGCEMGVDIVLGPESATVGCAIGSRTGRIPRLWRINLVA